MVRWEDLKPVQRRIMKELLNDKEINTIAHDLGYTRQTVYGHVSKLRKRFGVATTHGLIRAFLEKCPNSDIQ